MASVNYNDLDIEKEPTHQLNFDMDLILIIYKLIYSFVARQTKFADPSLYRHQHHIALW